MLPPDAEERFRRIEDAQIVTAELQRRAEARAKDDIERLEAIQNAMAQWMNKMADRQDEYESKLNILVNTQIRDEAETQKLREIVAELSRTVDRFLKARTNGGGSG